MVPCACCRPEAGKAEALELQWGAQHSWSTVEGLAAKRLDFVLASDACYDDQVRAFVACNSALTGFATAVDDADNCSRCTCNTAATCRCITQDGETPDPEQFFSTARALCSCKTRVLLALERRNEATFAVFMASAWSHFRQVQQHSSKLLLRFRVIATTQPSADPTGSDIELMGCAGPAAPTPKG